MGKEKYTDEFKEDALRRLNESGLKFKMVAKELGISRPLLKRWYNEHNDSMTDEEKDEEIARLKHELAKRQKECEILEKARDYFGFDK